jgi:arginase
VPAALILVPSHAGDEGHPAAAGPEALFAAGAADRLGAVDVTTVRRAGPFRDTASSAAEVNRQLATAARAAGDAGRFPVVLAGSCNACLGVLASFEHGRCGAVWLDAHADFNTPASSQSGFFAGMSLAIATGHCYRDYWATIGDAEPLREDGIVLLGVREVSPDAERERLQQSAIQVVAWEDGHPSRDPVAALDELAERVGDVYLHVDFDAFAPEVAPGVADEPVPGGLSLSDAERILTAVNERFRIQAATLATFTPERDRDGRTLQLALRLLELLG